MRRGDWLHGLGIASAVYPIHASAALALASDLSATPTAAGHDVDQAAYIVRQRIVARELGLDPARVGVEQDDSDLPANGGTGGSAQTASLGSAVLVACRQARAQATALGGALVRSWAATSPSPRPIDTLPRPDNHRVGPFGPPCARRPRRGCNRSGSGR